ncbi:hypothetical protein [Fulvimarina sp. MAC8]|uniref:hypothetical protein n=1 Tax=Fulvimarina sp. MAC8 TaxID=3162874 RepID=UPI0032EAACA9
MDNQSDRIDDDRPLGASEPGDGEGDAASKLPRQTMRIAGRQVGLPQNRWLRMSIGLLLVIGGIFGFLPILGVWMIPLGLVVLSIDLPMVRRWRRRSDVWVMRRYRAWQEKRAVRRQ